ncbi:MAG: porin family protein [Pseudomonadota bacterium]
MKKIAIAVLLSAFIAAPAVAADTPFYAGVNVGSAKIDFPGFDSTTSFALLGGYTFNENFAAEIAYSNFGSKDYPGGFNVKSSAISISGVGSYPINEQFSVFAKLGFASTTVDDTGSSQSKSDLTYGFGGQFNVNKQIGIRLGYDIYKVTDVINLDQKVTSIGAVLKF